MAKSPQIILRERDESSYAITSADTVLCVVGYATKGPIEAPTLVTSRNEFEEIFGPAPSDAPWSSLSIYRAFQQGNQILFYRVADSTAVSAEKVVLNTEDATSGHQEFTPTTPVSFGSYAAQEVYDFKLTIDGGTERDVYITSPATGDWTLANIATDINTQISSATSGFQETSTKVAPTIPTLGTEYRVQASVDSANLATTGGTTNTEFSVFLGPGVSLSNVAAALKAAFQAGTRGYHSWTGGTFVPGDSAGLAAGTYDFNVDVDGVGAANIQITTEAGDTYTEIAALMETAINAEFGISSVTVRAYTDLIVVQSTTEGATSSIVLSDDTIASDGTPLFAAIQGTAATFGTSTDGSAGTDTVNLAVNAATGRIRLTSSTTGIASVVAMTAPTIGNSLLTILGGALEANDGEAAVDASVAIAYTKRVRVTSDATGIASTVVIASGTGADNEDFVTLVGTETAENGAAPVTADQTDNILFRAKQKGSATNSIAVIKTSAINPVTAATIHTVEVTYLDNVVETFSDVSLNQNDTNFFVTLMNSDPDNGGSEWVELEYEDIDFNDEIAFSNGTYLLGSGDDEWQVGDILRDYDYRAGTDGIPSTNASALFVDAFSTGGDLANTERFDYHILVTPDNGEESTQNAAIALAEYRKDFFYVADPPFGLDYNSVADWHNGEGYGRGSAINTSYAGTYWPWMKEFNPVSGEYVWSPPSVFMAAKYMEIDRRFGPWYAVAGDTRGKIQGVADIETSPSLSQRDLIYAGLNAINPIVNFSAKGITIYGQKTLLRENSALNRVNVRRMLVYIKKLIRSAMEGIVFEPHNPDSWARATNLINSILEPVRQANGLDDYRVSINSSTNTQSNIAQGIMKGIIRIVPVGTIEVIDLTIAIQGAGTTIDG